MLVLLLYIMYVPFILPHTVKPLLTNRPLFPAPVNTYQAPPLFMARMKSTCQSRSLLCVCVLLNCSFYTVVKLRSLAWTLLYLGDWGKCYCAEGCPAYLKCADIVDISVKVLFNKIKAVSLVSCRKYSLGEANML